jgi:hypothetical protein
MHHDGAMKDIVEDNNPNHDEKIALPVLTFYYLIIYLARYSV